MYNSNQNTMVQNELLPIIAYDRLHEPRDHDVTPSFKPASLNPKTQLHMSDWFCASQLVTKIGSNVFPLVRATSLTSR